MKTLKKVMAVILSMAMAFSVMVTPASAAVTDIEAGEWYAAAAERWIDAGIMLGTSEETWSPAADITRQEVVAILVRVLGLTDATGAETFSDVDPNGWYAGEVAIGSANGITYGIGDGKFGVDSKITREEAFVMVARTLQMKASNDNVGEAQEALKNAYDDAPAVSDWAAVLVYAMHEAGYISGCQIERSGIALHPQHPITRGEVAVIMDRMIGVYVDAAGTVSTSTAGSVGKFTVANANAGEVAFEVTDEGLVVTVNGEEVVVEDITETTVVSGSTATDIDADSDKICVDGSDEVDVHTYVENCTNCAVAHTPYETCDNAECTNIAIYDEVDAHAHAFVEGVCECCGMTVEDAMKFQLTVSSEHPEDGVNYVDVLVTNDYVAQITVTDGRVSASNVTLYAAMQNVDSLGVANKRQHEQSFETGLTGDPDLSVWLSNAFSFNKATVNATIIDLEGNDYKTTYEMVGAVDADGNAVITGTPVSVEDTRTAWQALTANVETATQDASDSYINIANGSFLLIGDEILCFEKTAEGDLKLDNFGDLSAMSQMIRDMVQSYAKESDDSVVAFLAAGTELAVSNSVATLVNDCYVTVTAPGYLSDEDVAGVLTNIKTAESGYDMASELVTLLNTLIGKIGAEAVVDVELNFCIPEEKDTKFYFGISAKNADGEGTTTVDMEVFDDYSLEINLPMNKLDASEITLEVAMKNVASMGGGEKHHTQTIATGMTADGDLAFWMSNAPKFEKTTIAVSINNGPGVIYSLESDMDPDWVTVKGTPSRVEEARETWHALVNDTNFTFTTQDVSNSYFKIANTSEIHVGAEALVFEEGADDMMLDNFSDLGALKQEIKDSIKLVEGNGSIMLKVGAGTELAVSNSIATLNKDITIEIKDVELEAGILAEIRDNADSNEALVKNLFGLLNEAVGAMNNKVIEVEITIGE